MTKIAIIHNSLWRMRGAERVLLKLCTMYPEAEIYTLFGNPKDISPQIYQHKVHYSPLQRVPFISKIYRFTLPLWPIMIENFDLSEYDLVISISSSVSKGVITKPNTLHISYILTPARFLWDQKELYFKGYKKFLILPFLHLLRIWDINSSHRADKYIAISEFVSRRMEKYWNLTPDCIINPPVEVPDVNPKTNRSEYLLAVSPFQENKGIEYLLKSASDCGFRLKIIGDGGSIGKYRKKYSDFKNIEFLGWVSEQEKWELYLDAKGLLFLGIEDYGIVPVEAVSVGCPVIAFRGGAIEEIITDKVEGIILDDREPQTITKAIKMLETLPEIKAVSKKSFEVQFRQFVSSCLPSIDL
jgi:glycosyltransferase involved in cell wall biosynthesis